MEFIHRRSLSPDDQNFKRRMKTPLQREALERVYAENHYPSEALRAELATQLNLSEKQLRMWFNHRRLKDRKGKEEDSLHGNVNTNADTNVARKKPRTEKHNILQYPGAVPILNPSATGIHYAEEGGFSANRRNQPLPSKVAKLEAAAIAAVEAQLGEPLREDGPPLGLEFDPLPPGAFSTNAEEMPAEPRPAMEQEHFLSERVHEIPELQNKGMAVPSATLVHKQGVSKRKSMGPPSTDPHPHPLHYDPRPVREYQFIPEQPERLEENQYHERPTPLNLFPTPERTLELLQPSRAEVARLQKEAELQEKKMRKELEKQEVLRRKREEQIMKEQGRLERERKREEERISRERLKEQERLEKDQKKEAERMEKENKRMEKQRCREEARKEKEAAKLKAANERALAKRLAKEMTDLMDDEDLERMEAAAAASSLNLAYFASFGENGLDTSQVVLKAFPPSTVQMKPVVSIQPWSNSDQNVGNLLLVWRFLTTFADVIGLWPFTLDELLQSFHDYDSRLLGEIHVALLKTLVRDIEEAAHAVSGGTVGQRDAIAMAAGGHPQLVETAFAWGFDIREWGKHVNPLTWPEILRQFALAADFGPKWKKRKIAPHRLKEIPPEGEDGQDVVASLRSGAAAVSAVASMRGRRMGRLRRSRFRLTPGTVKYAAFHVLSLEGEKGLNIVEVAERIQTSGLRDLSSSKTPEASIAAALSRDTVLFERTAPSTYCVRSQFRKDSEDAEEFLSAARERVRLFRSSLVDGEEADKESDEADREEYESEGQDVDDVEDLEEEDLEDGVPDSPEIKSAVKIEDAKVELDPKETKTVMPLQLKKASKFSEGADNGFSKSNEACVSSKREQDDNEEEEHNLVKEDNLQGDNKSETQLDEDTEIDESQVGEPWVQGLVEGEYADLSVEERLNALVALVTVVNEGNAIRIALEERLEAATALKRQMWAEMQLEKRRHKEELLSRTHFLLLPDTVRIDGESPNPGNMTSGTLSPFDQGQLDMNVPNTDGAGLGEALAGNGKSSNGLSNGLVAYEAGTSVGATRGSHLAEKSRSLAKADIGLRADEFYVFRSQPLGSDRRHNRYWQFVTGNGGQDPGCGRLFFESNSDGHWGVIDTEEALDALLASLDPRGAREAALTALLHRLEGTLRQGMKMKDSDIMHISTAKGSATELDNRPALNGMEESPASSISGSESDAPEVLAAISVELGRSSQEQKQALERYREAEKWIWFECSRGGSVPKATKAGQRREARVLLVCDLCHDLYTNKDKHCQCCHATFDKSSSPRNFSEHTRDCEEKRRRGDPNWKLQGPVASMPSRLQLLKFETNKIESAIPAKALKKDWTDQQRKAWAAHLKSASEPDQVLQALTTLESMIERDWLSSTYETIEEIVSAGSGVGNFGSHGPVPFWVPPTTAAVALRIRLLDNALAYSQEGKEEREKQEIEDEINQKNTKMSTFKFTPEGEQDDEQPADMLDTVPNVNGKSRSRVRSSGAGRIRGGKGGQLASTGPGGVRRKTTASTGGESKSRTRTPSSSGKNDLKRKLQFLEGTGDAGPSGLKQVWGGAAKGRSARSSGGGRGKSARRPSQAQAGPRSRVRRSQPGSRKPAQKQKASDDLMVPAGDIRSKKTKVTWDDTAANPDREDDEMEEESNDSQAEEGYEDGDQYDPEGHNDDLDADEQNGSDLGECLEEDEEEEEEGNGEQLEEEEGNEEQLEEEEGNEEHLEEDEEGEDGEEVDEEGEEELEDDDGDREGQDDDDDFDREGPRGDVHDTERGGRSRYGRDPEDEEEEGEEEEAGGDETEDEDDHRERHAYSDED